MTLKYNGREYHMLVYGTNQKGVSLSPCTEDAATSFSFKSLLLLLGWSSLNLCLIICLRCRMLLDFSEQTKAQKFPEHASDQEMLEIVMDRLVLCRTYSGTYISTNRIRHFKYRTAEGNG